MREGGTAENYCGAHRLPAGRTAAKEESRRGVVPVRQKNDSKVDYYNCPRHMPLFVETREF
jgi:hypothetical protein